MTRRPALAGAGADFHGSPASPPPSPAASPCSRRRCSCWWPVIAAVPSAPAIRPRSIAHRGLCVGARMEHCYPPASRASRSLSAVACSLRRPACAAVPARPHRAAGPATARGLTTHRTDPCSRRSRSDSRRSSHAVYGSGGTMQAPNVSGSWRHSVWSRAHSVTAMLSDCAMYWVDGASRGERRRPRIDCMLTTPVSLV